MVPVPSNNCGTVSTTPTITTANATHVAQPVRTPRIDEPTTTNTG